MPLALFLSIPKCIVVLSFSSLPIICLLLLLFRAVFCHGSEVKQVSKDFTPDSERQRIYDLVIALSGLSMCFQLVVNIKHTSSKHQKICFFSLSV